jgi:hypothetical protein
MRYGHRADDLMDIHKYFNYPDLIDVDMSLILSALVYIRTCYKFVKLFKYRYLNTVLYFVKKKNIL